MPGLNRKGPLGEGALTGRKRGLCAKNLRPTDVNDENNNQADLPVEDLSIENLGFGGRGRRCRRSQRAFDGAGNGNGRRNRGNF